MMSMLEYPVVGPLVAWHLGAGLVVVFGLGAALRRARRAPPLQHPLMGARTCGHCRWRGQVSRYDETCRGCGKPFTTTS